MQIILRQNAALTDNERALSSCEEALLAEEAGDYERARGCLAAYWTRVGEEPNVNGLDPYAAAEVILRVGSLTGRLGSAKQIKGAQEVAKDLLSKACALYESLGMPVRVGEAQVSLGYCYLREAMYDEARAYLTDALSRFTVNEPELVIRAQVFMGYVERESKRLYDALAVLRHTATLIGEIQNEYLKGTVHNEYATVLKEVGLAEGRGDYLDKAIEEFTAASCCFQDAGHIQYAARVDNNLGFLLSQLNRFDEAFFYLKRARAAFKSRNDVGSVAQVDETAARAYLARGNNPEALKVIKSAVTTLEKGDETAMLAEALITYGVALARTNNHEQSLRMLLRAAVISREAGDLDSAGRAWLTMLEEVSSLNGEKELSAYKEAFKLLSTSQDIAVTKRLIKATGRIMDSIGGGTPSLPVSLPDLEREFEGQWFSRALMATGGHLTKSADLLGLGRQRFCARLKYHPDLDYLWKREREAKDEAAPFNTANVADIRAMFNIALPPGVEDTGHFITHHMTTESLTPCGVQPGDLIVVRAGECKEGEIVGATAAGLPLIVGHISFEKGGALLTPPNSSIAPTYLKAGHFTIEGPVVGYCKAKDVRACAAKGDVITARPIE